MSEKPTKRISELLDIFNSASQIKTAEEVDIADALDEDDATAAKAEVGTEIEADDPTDKETTKVLGKNEDESDADPMSEDEDDDDVPVVIADTTDSVGENDVPDTLVNIAKEASERHNFAITKEAMCFGEIFADSVLKRMQKVAEEEDDMYKYAQIQEDAYYTVLEKIAEGEMGGMPMQPGMEQGMPMPAPEEAVAADPVASEAYDNTMDACEECADLGEAADAVNTSASAALEAAKAAKTLVEAIQEQNEEDDEEEDSDPVAEEAYNQAMDQIQGGEPQGMPAPEEAVAADPTAANAYDQTMQAMQQPQGMY